MLRDELRRMAEFPLSPPIEADINKQKPDNVPQSTWDAFLWLRTFHPERFDDEHAKLFESRR